MHVTAPSALIQLQQRMQAAYAQRDYVIRQKAQALFWIHLTLLTIIAILLVINTARGHFSQLFPFIIIDVVLVAGLTAGLSLLVRGHYERSVRLNLICITAITVAGYLFRVELLWKAGGNYFVTEMFGVMVFAAMFGRRKHLVGVTVLFLAVALVSHGLAMKQIASDLRIYLESSMINTSLLLIIVFCLSLWNGIITDKALVLTKQELKRNVELNLTLEQKVSERTRALQEQTEARQDLIQKLESSLAR